LAPCGYAQFRIEAFEELQMRVVDSVERYGIDIFDDDSPLVQISLVKWVLIRSEERKTRRAGMARRACFNIVGDLAYSALPFEPSTFSILCL
jgi:hypothetical protein